MKTLILGGGFGGLSTANELRRLTGSDHEITLVDRRSSIFFGLRKLWVLAGRGTIAGGERPLARLEARGISVIEAEVLRIDARERRVETSRGTFDADYLVIALGAEPRPDLVAGMTEHAFNLYEARSVEAAAARIAALEEGRVAIVIAGMPYKCPPAPYEAALMLDDVFRRRGVRERVDIAFTTMQPGLLPNAGVEGARWIGRQLEERGISWAVARAVDRFERGRVHFRDIGEPLSFDIAIAAPPHRVPRVVSESGLTEGDWIRVDRATLATAYVHVFAIGDVTHIPLANNMPLPKAGIFAEAEGVRVARAIAAELTGAPAPAAFDGRGHCFLEMGAEDAAMLRGDFFAEPAPAVQLMPPSAENLAAKHRFETERLERWLGS
jgi:sulfide:quinone oxidoreductase